MSEKDSMLDENQQLKDINQRSRNYFLLFMLSIMAIFYLFPTIRFLIIGQVPSQILSINTPPSIIFPIFGAVTLLNIIFLFAIFKWKKWGFWGLLILFAPTVFLKYRMNMSLYAASFEIIGTMLLFCALRIGKKSVWSQME